MNAARYDVWYDSPLGKACFAAETALLRQGAHATTGKAILEVGCGSGRFLQALGQDAARAVGIDRDASMLAVARRSTSPGSAQRYTWIQGDAGAMPFADDAFDVVFENTVLCFCVDPAPVIREMVRVCRPGGAVLLGELHPYAPWQWWRRLKAAFGKGSFQSASWRRPRDLVAALTASGCRACPVGRAIFSPPLNITNRLRWRSVVEWLGARLWPWAGAYYVVGGTKRERTEDATPRQ